MQWTPLFTSSGTGVATASRSSAWDGSGFWLMTKRLEAEHFIWPGNKTEVVTLTTDLLHALLDGDDITTIHRHPRREYLRVS
ncbi:transposase [Paraburkholderia phytofirmans]|uniref:transposase n=1 Tax=Paraburkholderia phytofirmans TaxID=261302 RepID=UPI002112C300|nr:transposase [Paraburkholderia phytofirmans]